MQRSITLGAVQVRSLPAQVEANLAHATPLIEAAAAEGAELIALPELFSSGYSPDRSVWSAAEPEEGLTVSWLRQTARRLGVFLGAGCVESDGRDFFNTFILAGPDGELAGRAYKSNAEANVFRRGRREHVITTALGRIGVGICADNQLYPQLDAMHAEDVDLILMPHAWPTPVRAGGPVSEADVRAYQARMIELPSLYARSLGVPVVFVNQVGALARIGGLLGRMMNPEIWSLRGQSRIVDSEGTVVGELADTEGFLASTVTIDPAAKRWQEPRRYGTYLQPGPAIARKVLIPLSIAQGRVTYQLSRERRQKARTLTET